MDNTNETKELAHAPQQQDFQSRIMHLASNPDFDADKLDKLIQMNNDQQDRQDRKEAMIALGKFKQACPQIRKTKNVLNKQGGKNYSYSPMQDLVAQIGGLAKENGLVWRFNHIVRDRQHFTVCLLLHAPTGFEFEPVEVQVDPAGANKMTSTTQASGITMSYGERYALKAALGLVFRDEDTDGILPEDDPAQNYDEQICMLIVRDELTAESLVERLNEKMKDPVPEGGWTWLDTKVKKYIVDNWAKLWA